MYHLNPLIMRPLEKQLDNQAGPLVYWPGIEVVVLGCEGTGAVGGGKQGEDTRRTQNKGGKLKACWKCRKYLVRIFFLFIIKYHDYACFIMEYYDQYCHYL